MPLTPKDPLLVSPSHMGHASANGLMLALGVIAGTNAEVLEYAIAFIRRRATALRGYRDVPTGHMDRRPWLLDEVATLLERLYVHRFNKAPRTYHAPRDE